MRARTSRIRIFRSKFTPEEDCRLEALVSENGTADWPRIGSKMPHRDSRQCKERWSHYLSPDIVQRPWTKAEDVLLETKVSEHGRKWKLFEAFFPSRVDTNIRNRFNVLLRQRQKEVRFVARAFVPPQPRVLEVPVTPGVAEHSELSDKWNLEGFEWTSF
jgi:hypothetical protein